MKDSTQKEYGAQTILTAAAVMLAMVFAVMFLCDPFFHYHKNWFGLSPFTQNKEYGMPGAVTNLEYDALLVGSSTVMSIDSDLLGKRDGVSVIKAVGNSASAANLRDLLVRAQKKHSPQTVYYGLDVFSLVANPEFTPNKETEFMWDSNPLNDVEYFWNLDIISWDLPYLLVKSVKGDFEPGKAYSFGEGSPSGAEAVLVNYHWTPGPPEVKEAGRFGEDIYENVLLIEKSVREMPDTQFEFFLPVYTVLWWDGLYRQGDLEEYLMALVYCVERLLQYSNVTIYNAGFDDSELIGNLDLFIDNIHGTAELEAMTIEAIGNPGCVVDAADFEEEISAFRELLHSYAAEFEKAGYVDFFLTE